MESGCGNPPAQALGMATEAEPEKPEEAAPSKEGQDQQQRSLRAVYICNESPEDRKASGPGPEEGALKCLVQACEAQGAFLSTVRFGELDFKETAVLHAFYHADIAVVDMSDISRQPSLFYHLGIRESFNMTNNVILYCDTDIATSLSLKDMVTQKNTVSSGNYYFIPYIITPCAEYICCESDLQRDASEYLQTNWDTMLNPLHGTLVDRFISLLRNIQIASCVYHKETLLNDIQRAREIYKGDELAKELARIKLHIDDTEILTSDIIINLLLSYCDIQDYDAMVKLVETLDMLPMCDLTDQYNIKFHYAFALNRKNSAGDREKALQIMLQVLQNCDCPAPGMFCLCGMIYKDIFLDSHCKDNASRDSAIEWYRRGFELQSSLYSGINLSILLIVAGQQFETSMELRKIGIQLSSMLGRKGCLEKMNNYWDVGQFLSVTMLANNVEKSIQAAEKLFRLKPPVWYLRSLVQNLFLILRFKKFIAPLSRRELLNFWLDIIFEASKEVANGLRFPVLVIEPTTKIYQPSYVSINNDAEERMVSLWLVSPPETKQIHEWNFEATSIKGISISTFDEQCCFLYVYDNSDDFQICFSTKEHCSRFCFLVKEMITNEVDNTVELEEDTDEDTLEYEYDLDMNGNRVVLGKGSYGIVYAGRDLSNQLRIAIKEIPEKDFRNSQSLHNEIALHKNLKHRNIVQYLGSVSENGYIKIFMEQVPGGSLSSLLKSKWGPIKESTLKVYTKQILEGLNYLHQNQIVHRDIKGDNILVNTYSGVVKISDFGTSARLVGVNACTETFAGTLQYMAPEIIGHGLREYGSAADIWSLGCTIIEMATGEPPFYELGDPQVAMYKVGLFKIHPEIPEVLSVEARVFLLSCFEPDPHKRATAADLLKKDFLRQVNKGKKTRIVFKPSASSQVTLGEFVGSSSREHNRGPLELDAQLNRLENAWEPMHGLCNLLRVQDDSWITEDLSTEDQNSALNPKDRDPDLFLLHQDQECRAILCKILWNGQDLLASNLQEYLVQNSEEPHLSVDHIKQIIWILRDFIHSEERGVMASRISELKVALKFDSFLLSQIHLILFGFQNVVSKMLRHHLINVQWLCAMDIIIQRVVMAAVVILISELRAHFEATEETEGVNEDPDEVDQDGPPADPPGSEARELQQDLSLQLDRLRRETGRLLKNLLQAERAHKNLIRQSLKQQSQQLCDFQSQLRSNGEEPRLSCGQRTYQEFVDWLQMQGADANTIEKIVKEGYKLSDILNDITKEDLRYLGLRGGLLCKLWSEVSQYRRQTQGAPATQDEG
ncbi:PREDICTED: mitogen-activated protein kinase kinase kinase 15 [Myotis brandtii]|uniref:mitogen-activated protein kinase kinase kinase 15 n=1 Tax=Myotis brandtii TaxID=109478 RepID=UPI0003BB865B|nr:PREDICTED: mitogen-activated protein kinase kinase kinase 15 [Myotis brandtii]